MGGDWDAILDRMSIKRVKYLQDFWNEYPPVPLLIAWYMGLGKDAEGEAQSAASPSAKGRRGAQNKTPMIKEPQQSMGAKEMLEMLKIMPGGKWSG